MAIPDHQEDGQVILEQIKPETSGEAKMTKLKVSYFGHSMRKQGFLEKAIMLGIRKQQERGRPNVGWTDSIRKP